MIEYLNQLQNKDFILPALAGIVVIILIVIIVKNAGSPAKKAISKLKRKQAETLEGFLAGWNADKSDFPGCYIITAYKRKIVNNYMRFNEVYIGQSVNVRKRVHSHITGHGNGDVYHLICSEYQIRITTIKCKEKKLNATEKELIDRLGAIESLNYTVGGSAKR